jgi:NAD(P)-dependent dehydrogenase (short-subunit alcohol dehydrogenase family)
MARILITGSSDGLGLRLAQHLVSKNHSVVLHARNTQRANDARAACPDAEGVVIGDLSSIKQTVEMAEQINSLASKDGRTGFDAVVFNAGLYRGPFRRTAVEEVTVGGETRKVGGVPALMAVNSFSTYVLACLIQPTPKRVVFLSSQLHSGGDGELRDIDWKQRGEKGWSAGQAYGDSKLHNIMFAGAFNKVWKGKGWDGYSNSMDPGWVATKMGGASAPGSWDAAIQTYEYLATEAEGSGGYWRPGKKKTSPVRVAEEERKWDVLMQKCAEVTGVKAE